MAFRLVCRSVPELTTALGGLDPHPPAEGFSSHKEMSRWHETWKNERPGTASICVDGINPIRFTAKSNSLVFKFRRQFGEEKSNIPLVLFVDLLIRKPITAITRSLLMLCGFVVLVTKSITEAPAVTAELILPCPKNSRPSRSLLFVAAPFSMT